MLSNIEKKIQFFEYLQNDYVNNIVYRLLVYTLDDRLKDLLYTTLSSLNGNVEEALNDLSEVFTDLTQLESGNSIESSFQKSSFEQYESYLFTVQDMLNSLAMTVQDVMYLDEDRDDKMILYQLLQKQSFLKSSLSSLIEAYDTVLYENGTHTIKA